MIVLTLGNSLSKTIIYHNNYYKKCYYYQRDNKTLVEETNDPSKCYDNYEYNAKSVAVKEIKAGKEIFYPYSWDYWRHHAYVTMNLNLSSTSITYTYI